MSGWVAVMMNERTSRDMGGKRVRTSEPTREGMNGGGVSMDAGGMKWMGKSID